MRYKLDQTLIVEAGLLAHMGAEGEVHDLLAAYEGAADLNDFPLAAKAEIDLRAWVGVRRRRKWSCGETCPTDCKEPDCQFRKNF